MIKPPKRKYGLSSLLCFFMIMICSGQERYISKTESEIRIKSWVYSDTLELDYYSSPTDTLSLKPLILLVHGGGFAMGKRDNPLEKSFSEEMVRKGFAVASISYRLLRKGKSFGCDCPAKEKVNTFKEAARDILTATTFLVERSDKLKFDPEKIILVGSSAGAEAVLNTAFMQYHHDFNELPYEKIKYAGLVSFAGAVLDVDYITDNNKIPVLLFHGEKDNLVPFATAPHHYCLPGTPGYLILEGAASIADRMAALDGSYQLIYDPEGNHDWANIPYSRAKTISRFLWATVLEGQNIQSRIRTKPKN